MTAVLIPTDGEAAWLEARRAGVTASEIAVVMGLSPWSSPYALYHRKAGTLPEPEDAIEMALGRYLEDFVSSSFGRARPEFLVEGNGRRLYSHPDRPWQIATPDRLVHEYSPCGTPPRCTCEPSMVAVLECKTDAGYDGWGEDGTDEIPVHYRCQVLWQMDVMGTDAGFVACLFLHSRQLRVYELAMDGQARADLELMRAEAQAFLACVRRGIEPEPDWRPATTDALKRLHPDVEDRDAHVSRQLEISYRSAVRRYREAAERKKLMENRLRAAMGSAQRAIARGTYGPDNDRVVIATRQVYDLAAKTIERSACTVDKLVPAKERTP